MKNYIKSAVKAIYFLSAVVLIIITLFLPACDNAKPIKIGFVGGLTGRHYGLGVSARNGAILAAEEINKKGGINGRKVQLIIKDDMQDAKVLQKVFAELLDEGVVAVIGPVTSGMSLIVTPLINERRTVAISPTATSSKLAEKDDYFIKINSNVSVFSEIMADYIVNKKKLKRIAVIYDLYNRAYTEEFLTTFKSKFTIKDGIIQEFSYNSSEKLSYSELSRKLISNNPDGILMITNTFDTAMLCQHIRKLNSRIPLFSSPWAMTEDILSSGGKSVEGLVFGQTYVPDTDNPELNEFRKKFKGRFSREPDFASVKAYDAANMLFSVIPLSKNKETLKDTIIKRQRFKGVAGDLVLSKYGDIEEKAFLVTINDNRFIRLQ